ncbi:MAG: response regulator transcription factor [Clostridiaceae bacterium]|jgi:DNA-binding response OmpR family regulator|nr:response regulator transcription factor [Clostridiaceae bacterium]
MPNILICDDEPDIVSALQIYLQAEGYTTLTARTGREALRLAADNDIHLILLDIMMPEMDGITALAKLRETCNVPVILLTAKSEDTDKVLGLNIGADDYITKPFNPVEVLARVKSQLRRYLTLGSRPAREDNPTHYAVGSLELDDKGKLVLLDGEPVSLTPTEFEILKLLMQHAGEVLSPRDIYRRVWNGEPYGAESTVAVHIRHLREKIEINPAEPRLLKVVWAQGYKLDGEKRP